MFEQARTFLLSTDQCRLIQLDILHGTYYTPVRLHKFNNISPRCQKCKVTDVNLSHIMWHCLKIAGNWEFYGNSSLKVLQKSYIFI